uniref:Peptidoglycan binding-like domain-containing protein n=1 Tax=Romanomermis culicivorax TaxID=13658 RepID=A0A915IRA5_ROMCU
MIFMQMYIFKLDKVRWQQDLASYTFGQFHRKGTANINADDLSQKPAELTVVCLEKPQEEKPIHVSEKSKAEAKGKETQPEGEEEITSGQAIKDRRNYQTITRMLFSAKNCTKYTYLKQFGYLKSLPPPKGQTADFMKNYESDKKEKQQKALKQFQSFAGLPVTGKLDDATKAKMLAPRCSLADVDGLRKGINF